MKARTPRERGKIAPPPPSSAGARPSRVPPVHLVSLVTTGQNWPLVPNPSASPDRVPPVSAAVERAAARSPRMSIDVELDFDGPDSIEGSEMAASEMAAPEASKVAPVVIRFGPPPSLSAPTMPKRDAAIASGEVSVIAKPAAEAPIADLAPPIEHPRRPPFAVGFLCLLSLAGSIAIVAMKLLP